MSPKSQINPYPGLHTFEQKDTDFFFGRESHIEELLRKLQQTRFVAVVGTSGSGKSSLVRAGLLPALYGDMLGVGSHWRVALFRPGDGPIRNLADELFKVFPPRSGVRPSFQRGMLETTLRRSSFGLLDAVSQTSFKKRDNILVIVDQFEELFRFHDQINNSNSGEESASFVKLLLEAGKDQEIPIYVLITMRSDFLGDCSRYRDLPETINRGLYLLPRLTREQLRQAIEGPAAVAGGNLSPALVERLLNDIGDDQDQLPVLQHALMRTWNPTRTITLKDYEAIGTMARALSDHADEALNELSIDDQKIARKVFQCITVKGPDNREVRRPTRFEDISRICDVDDSTVRRVVECFRSPDRSFLMPPYAEPILHDTHIDISHESLIRKWVTLRRWVNEEAESADWFLRVTRSGQLHHQGREGLWRDPALQFALDKSGNEHWNSRWARLYGQDFFGAFEYLVKSQRARDAEIELQQKVRQKQWQRIRRVIGLLLATVLIGAFVVSSHIVLETRDMRRQIYAADMSLAQRVLNDGNFEQTKIILQRYIPRMKKINDEDDFRSFHWFYLSRLADREVSGPVVFTGHRSSVRSVVFFSSTTYGSSDRLASGSDDNSIKLWDIKSGQELGTLKGHSLPIRSLAISPSPNSEILASGSDDNSIKLWNIKSGQELGTLKGHSLPIRSLAISPDEKILASGSDDNSIKLWDIKSGQELGTLKGHSLPIRSLAISPDEKILASGSDDNSIKVWDIRSRQELGTLRGHKGIVLSVAFLPDGRFIVSGSNDKSVRVWELGRMQQVESLHGQTEAVRAVAVSRDGRTIGAANEDRTITSWDLITRRHLATISANGCLANSLAFSRESDRLTAGCADANIRIW